MTGTAYGVGLGPGDPELMTLKADRLIRNAQVVAYPAPDTGVSFARNIAKERIRPDAVEIPIVVPMVSDPFDASEIYDNAAAEVSRHLEDNRDVVVLCQGDPFFYGSFMYLFERLSRSFPGRNRARRHVDDGLRLGSGAAAVPAQRVDIDSSRNHGRSRS